MVTSCASEFLFAFYPLQRKKYQFQWAILCDFNKYCYIKCFVFIGGSSGNVDIHSHIIDTFFLLYVCKIARNTNFICDDSHLLLVEVHIVGYSLFISLILFTSQPLRTIRVLFSPMVSGLYLRDCKV